MALSSISVVSNSLLLRFFRPRRRNWASTLAPAVMIVAFSLLFLQFARLSSGMSDTSTMARSVPISQFVASGQTRLGWAMTNAKLLLGVNEINVPELRAAEGTLTLGENEMVLGFSEAQMMRQEKLFQRVGDVLKGFMGLPEVRIVGVLAQTRTTLDMYHLMSPETLRRTINTTPLDAADGNGMIKLFYRLGEQSVPAPFAGPIAGDPISLVKVDGRPAVPLYLGAAEARMMVMERLFRQPGDVIEDLFGNRVVIAGVLKPTYGVLDELHLAGPALTLPATEAAAFSSATN
jgi:hypothetical protein